MDFVRCLLAAGGFAKIESSKYHWSIDLFTAFFAQVMVWTQQPSDFVTNRLVNCALL